MSTDARIRKAWLRWIKELEHSEKMLASAVKSNLSVRIAVRLAFEAGYRAKRRPEKLVNKC